MSSPTVEELPKMPADLAQSVIGKVELKKVDTVEKNVLPTKEDVAQERTHVEMLTGIENFSPNQLKHANMQEKTVLPSPDDIKAEKQHQELTTNIEKFSPEKLRHAETEEKIILPSKEDIAREKVVDLAAHFDKNQLKHVEPNVKTGIEVIDQ